MTLKSQYTHVYLAFIQRLHVNTHILHPQKVYNQTSFSTPFTQIFDKNPKALWSNSNAMQIKATQALTFYFLNVLSLSHQRKLIEAMNS